MSVAKDLSDATGEDGFRIRPLRADDIPVLQAIDRRITQRVPSWPDVDVYLAGKPLLSFVAEYEGRIIGFLLGDVKSYEFGLAQSAWIEAMGVAPDCQRQGVGKRLVQTFAEHARRSGIKGVQALIKANDPVLESFLRDVGFERGELISMRMS